MKIKKIISILLLVLIIINSLRGVVNAVDIDSAYIENLGQCENHLQYKNAKTGKWSYVVTTMVGYRINGNLHYAYCLNVDKHGVGDEENYSVNVSEMLLDEKIWRAITNGFPYKTASELGVANDQDAFVATKQAVYSVLYNRDVDSFYRGGDERGAQICNAIKNIVDVARNGTQTPDTTNLLNINKVGKFKKDTNNYYSQEYSVSSNVDVGTYEITQIANFPEGTYIADMNNNIKSTFAGGENFKVLIPKDKIIDNIKGEIEIKGTVKTYPVFYGKSYDPNLQDYALTYETYASAKGETSLTIDAYKSKLEVIKTDNETNKPISNVEFNAKYEDGTEIGNFITNKDGIIEINGLKQGKIILTEIKTQKQYILDKEPKEITIGYDEIASIDITNKYKTGNLKIIKVDKDNQDVKLEKVEFDLIDSNGNIVKHLITNEKGETEAQYLKIGNYILIETKTREEYKIPLNQDITIEWNKTFEIKVENEKIKGQIKIIKTSADDNLINGEKAGTPIANVKFEIYDYNQNLVDEVVTGEDGIAITKKLPKGKYIIKEVETGEYYELNQDKFEIEIINDGEIVELNIENKSKTPHYEEVKRLPVTGY